jgi:hypothetical protein
MYQDCLVLWNYPMWIGILALIIVAATGITVYVIAAHQDIG